MTKVIIVTHGPLADAFKESGKMFFREQSEKIISIGLYPENSPTDLLEKINRQVDLIEDDPILFLVDIFGGTPFNTVALLIEEYKDKQIECLTGLNMPVLMEILSMVDDVPLPELLETLQGISKESIVNLRKALDI